MTEQSSEKDRGRDKNESKSGPKPLISTTSIAEWAVAAAGMLLFASMLAYMGFVAATTSGGPPRPVISTKPPVETEAGHVVDYTVANKGETSATQMVISGRLMQGDAVVEERHALIDYVPQGSEQNGSLVFALDPAGYRLSVTVSSFGLP